MRLEEVEPRLGDPLRVSLTLHNGGSEPLLYDNQGLRLGNLEILGPGGEPVPYNGWRASTFGWSKELAPGTRIDLLAWNGRGATAFASGAAA